MRILHCIYDDPFNPWLGGGAALRVWEIYRRLAAELDVTVFAGAYPGARPVDREGVRYEFGGLGRSYPVSRLTYGRAATARLRAGRYDAALFDFSVYTPIRVPRQRPIGHVAHMLIGPRASDRWGGWIGRVVRRRERRMLRRVRHLSATSQWLAAQLRALLPDGAGVRVVGSGVAAELFDVVRNERDYVLFYGRFDWFQKGLDLLFGAAERLLSADPHLRLVIAGRGKDRARVEAAAASHANRGQIEIVTEPSPSAVRGLLAGARVLLHPSRFEGLPVVPAEAMAAGVPVVATRVGAMEEIIRGEEEGVVIVPDDPGALLEAASNLLTSPELRNRISRGARAAARRFSWDVVAREHLRFLEEVHALPSR